MKTTLLIEYVRKSVIFSKEKEFAICFYTSESGEMTVYLSERGTVSSMTFNDFAGNYTIIKTKDVERVDLQEKASKLVGTKATSSQLLTRVFGKGDL